jgi:Tfp pilus assembly protein PilO
VFQAQLREIDEMGVNNQKIEEALTKARDIESQINDLRRETQQIETLVTEFEERLPSEREIVSLVSDVEGMATAENVQIEMKPMPSRSTRRDLSPLPREIIGPVRIPGSRCGAA